MTLERARQLLATQVSFGGGYNRNGARLILADVIREHGQAAADQLIREMRLDQLFGFRHRASAVRICILSDSHDRGPMMAAAVTVAIAEGAEAVIHCGDIIGGNTLRASLKLGIPIHAIHGNNLGDPVSIARIAHNSDEQLHYHGQDAMLKLGGRRIFITHYPHIGHGMACTGDYDLVCCGHSHETEIRQQPTSRAARPGWSIRAPSRAWRPHGDLGAWRPRCTEFEIRELPRAGPGLNAIDRVGPTRLLQCIQLFYWNIGNCTGPMTANARIRAHKNNPGARCDGFNSNQPDHPGRRRRHQRHDGRARSRRMRQAGHPGRKDTSPRWPHGAALPLLSQDVPSHLRAGNQPAAHQAEPQHPPDDHDRGDLGGRQPRQLQRDAESRPALRQ
jgi:putative phosphoesterase